MPRVGSTDLVREELIAVHATKDHDRKAEAAGLLRTAGELHLRPGGTFAFEARHVNAGVARRIHEAITETLAHPDETRQEQPGQGHPRARYLVRVEPVGRQRLALAGILNADGLPDPVIPRELVAKACCAAAYLRGAFLARGSVQSPRKDPHLEIRCDNEEAATSLVGVFKKVGAEARARSHRGGFTVACKSHESVVTALTAMGAHTATMEQEQARIWRSLHSDANRLRNADSGNASRHANAVAAQLAAIASLDGKKLAPALAEIARLRVEDPDASLSELAAQCDPAISRAAAADRLRRLVRAASEKRR